MNPDHSPRTQSFSFRPSAAPLRALTLGTSLALSLALLTGCPSKSETANNEGENVEPVQIDAVKPVGLTPDEIDAANSKGLALAERVGRQVTAWYGPKDQTVKFTHAGDTLKIDDAHSMAISADDWKILGNFIKLKRGRDITVPTPPRSDKDSLGTLDPVAYKLHKINDTSFEMKFVGLPAGAG